MRTIFLAVISGCLLVAALAAESAIAAGKKTVDYRPELARQSPKLDIYSFDGAKDAPVVIYVHGGAWMWGNRRQVGQKPEHFNQRGYVFVSVDYRLVPNVNVEDQLEDLDQALGWIAANIGEHGGNPSNLQLMGHSAGAHLVAMVGVKPGKTGRALIDDGSLRSIISNDTMAYDVLSIAAARGDRLPSIYAGVFGDKAERWKSLSPQHHINGLKKNPAFLVLFSGQRFLRARTRASLNFAYSLRQSNAQVAVFDGSEYSHRQMTTLIGEDERLTQAIDEFLARYK